MRIALAAVAAAVLLAQAVTAPPAAAQAVVLTHPAALARDNAALPRIAAPATPATAKVNAALARVDASWRAFRRECASGGGTHNATTRTVAVAMAGPTILSLVVTDYLDCGGAHPNDDDFGLAYDLTTGRPLDWTKLLPASLVQSTSEDTTSDGTEIGMVSSTQLHAFYLKLVAADPSQDADLKSQCAEVVADDGLALQLWPDAGKDAVVVQPFDLPHAVAVCGLTEPIRTADLRRLGADAALLDAIDAAHAVDR